MNNRSVTIMPLGGVGEIGRNCTVLECGDSIVVLDAGLMFPEQEMLGVDIVIPDFRYLVQNRDRIRGIIVSHGHEDHVGALPYLLRDISAPVYATPLTRGLIENKLRSRTLREHAQLYTILPGDEIPLGDLRITPFHVNHSIPNAIGLAIRTPIGLLVHTGDFKIDHTPLEGRTTDLGQLARLSAEGVILLMADSTNAESPGYTASESQLIDTFHRVFHRARGRIIVATFASLLSRIQLVIETAAEMGRKVAVAGRSMEENIAIAEKLGYVRFPPDTRMTLDQIATLPDHQVCILATGAQGEPNAALARMAAGRFRQVHIKEGDTVLFSSKAIPGNETQIHRNIDNLFRLGANVVYGEEAGLHVSGHAAQEELKLMLNLLRPLYFAPLHGEYRMLRIHANLALELGFAPEDVFVLDKGDRLILDDSGARLGEPLPVEEVYVDGSLVGDVGTTILRDRMALSQDGFVIAKVAVEADTGHVAGDPQIISQGFVYIPESEALMQAAQSAIIDVVDRYGPEVDDPEEIAERIKRRLQQLFYEETRRRPVIIPLVTAA
ncbi:MAG: ribonuclease J [Chloroflexi bacterium]|nr:ribonuclease J [Chloroflexota bacterium]